MASGVMERAGDQGWAADKPEGTYRFPSQWLEDRAAEWNGVGKPHLSTMEDLEDIERLEKLLEAEYCKEEGYKQILQCVTTSKGKKLSIEEEHCVIEVDDEKGLEPAADLGTNTAERMNPKLKRKLLKAMEQVKAKVQQIGVVKHKTERNMQKWSKMQVMMKNGKDKMKQLLKTMTRKEAMAAMKPEAGKNKKKKKSEKKEKEVKQKKLLKPGKFLKAMKAVMEGCGWVEL